MVLHGPIFTSDSVLRNRRGIDMFHGFNPMCATCSLTSKRTKKHNVVAAADPMSFPPPLTVRSTPLFHLAQSNDRCFQYLENTSNKGWSRKTIEPQFTFFKNVLRIICGWRFYFESKRKKKLCYLYQIDRDLKTRAAISLHFKLFILVVFCSWRGG